MHLAVLPFLVNKCIIRAYCIIDVVLIVLRVDLDGTTFFLLLHGTFVACATMYLHHVTCHCHAYNMNNYSCCVF